jgi:selenocysteine lyase/cysteine desulfurase
MPFFPEAPALDPITPAADVQEFAARYRASVPALRKFIYCNHASVGPLSDWVVDAAHEPLRQQQMAATVIQHDWFDGWRQSRQRVAELLGDGNRGNVCLHSSTYSGLVRAFNALPLGRGDEALCPADEFPSVYHALTELRDRGVTLRTVGGAGGPARPDTAGTAARPTGIVTTEDVLNAITPATRLIAISWVAFAHGYRHDIALLGRECRARGIWLAVDVIQGVGMLRLDAQATGAHFISGQGAKWLSAPLGSGYLWVSPDMPEEITPRTEGWFGMELNHLAYTDRTIKPKANANRFASGTVPMPSAYGLRRACEVILEAGPQRAEELALGNADAIDTAATEAGYTVFSDRRAADGSFGPQRSAIISLRIDNAPALADTLRSADVVFSVREGFLRLSPHWYNTADEIGRVCDIIRACAPGQAAPAPPVAVGAP